MNMRQKLQESWVTITVAFLAAACLALSLSAPRGGAFPIKVRGEWMGANFLATSQIDLVLVAALVFFGFALYLVHLSHARFFILGSSIIGGEISFHLFDKIDISAFLQNGTGIIFRASRETDWRIHIPLLFLAGGLLFIDHRRRPPAQQVAAPDGGKKGRG